MESSINRQVRNSHFTLASLPERHPLAQAIALALALGAGATQAAVFNVTTNADSGQGSLRQAVLDANDIDNPGADQITFDAGLGTIALISGQIDITDTLTITGPAAGQTIDAGGYSRIFGVTVEDQPLTLENLTLTGGFTGAWGGFRPTCADGSGEGGGICSLGDVTLINCVVSNNSAGYVNASGGGLYLRDADITLTNSIISSNSASADGGGLFIRDADAILTNSIVSGNRTTGGIADGGGIFLWYGNISLDNSTVSGNSTTGSSSFGGGISISDGNATLANSTVSDNSTASYTSPGGGLHLQRGNAVVTNSTISGNNTSGDRSAGGGLHIVIGNLSLTDSTVSGNSTEGDSGHGGGLAVSSGGITLANSTISGNSTSGNLGLGAGLFLQNCTATLNNSTVNDNVSAAGAGGIQIDSGHFGGGSRDTLTLFSTVLAANIGPEGNFYPHINSADTVTLNASNSLFGDDPSEINGVDSDNVFTNAPELVPLANNGCAVKAGAPGDKACVQTHALLPDSPAVDWGTNPLNLTTDQRGTDFSRVVGDATDIGAFELGACYTLHMTDHIVSTTEAHNDCQIHAGPNMTVTPDGNLTLKSKVRVVLDKGVWIQKGGQLRIQIGP